MGFFWVGELDSGTLREKARLREREEEVWERTEVDTFLSEWEKTSKGGSKKKPTRKRKQESRGGRGAGDFSAGFGKGVLT